MASINYGGVINPFDFQTIFALVIFMPYWNKNTLGDVFKSIRKHENNEYDIFQHLAILNKIHPE